MYQESTPVISSTSKPQFALSQTITQLLRSTPKVAAFQQRESESQFAQSEKLLRWKVLYKSFIVSLGFQHWHWLHAWKHSHLPKKTKAWLSSLWLYILYLLTPVIFVIFGNSGGGVQCKRSFHYSYSTLCNLLANSIKRGSPCWVSQTGKCHTKKPHENRRREPRLEGSLPGRCATAKEVNSGMNSAVHPRCLYPLLSPSSAATLESFPFGYV